LDCYKRFNKDADETYLKTYQPGEAFGELALLYNAPRAATIRAKTNCCLWALDRDTFNNIVKDAATKKRESYEAFLSKIELLKDMDPYERSKIADAFKPLSYSAGDYVVKEGDEGDCFFFLEQGEAIATKIVNTGNYFIIIYLILY
jgi:cAMP-dependent protein kinase regulator